MWLSMSVISGYHDEHLPSVYGGWINGEEVRWQHKKGLCLPSALNISRNFTLPHNKLLYSIVVLKLQYM